MQSMLEYEHGESWAPSCTSGLLDAANHSLPVVNPAKRSHWLHPSLTLVFTNMALFKGSSQRNMVQHSPSRVTHCLPLTSGFPTPKRPRRSCSTPCSAEPWAPQRRGPGPPATSPQPRSKFETLQSFQSQSAPHPFPGCILQEYHATCSLFNEFPIVVYAI